MTATISENPKPDRSQKGVLCVRNYDSAKAAVRLMAELAPRQVASRPLRRPEVDWIIMTPQSMNGIRGLWVPNLVVLYDIEDELVFPRMYEEFLPSLDRPHSEAARIYRLSPIRIPGL